jgi:hypothetical protein
VAVAVNHTHPLRESLHVYSMLAWGCIVHNVCMPRHVFHVRMLQVLDPCDRKALPKLSAWFSRCFDDSAAMRQVWKGELVLCEQASVDGGKKPKESKEEKKAREKARKKERDAAKKAEKGLQPAAAPATSGAVLAELVLLAAEQHPLSMRPSRH